MIVQQPAGGKVLKLGRWGEVCQTFLFSFCLEPRRKRWGFCVRALVEFVISGGYDNVKKR